MLHNMKKLATILISIFITSLLLVQQASAQGVPLQIRQGGTGVGYPGGFQAGAVPFGAGLSPLATSTGFTFSSGKLTFTYGSTTALTISSLSGSGTRCVQVDNNGFLSLASAACGSGSGGTGTISTSTTPSVSGIAYWTTSGSYPELLSSVATTTLTASSPLSLSNPVAKIGGSNSVLTIDTSGTWTGNAGTASALAANGSNCSSGSFAAGVDASGVAEGCTDVWTEAENTAAAYARFPFTVNTGYNSTSTVIGFNGLFSTASSTFSSALRLSSLSQGFLYVGSGSLVNTAASSSLFGYTPLNPTRQLTVAGTANQITSSAGAQDLSADRTWTLSIPSQFNIQQASTTIFSAFWAKIGKTASTTIGTDGLITTPGATVDSGAAGDAVVTFGPTSNEWTMGYDDTNKDFVIASSTALGTNNILSLTKNGALTLTGLSDGCLNITSGVVGSTGSACGSGSGGSDPFTHAVANTSATTTLMLLYGNASSTQFSANTGYFNYFQATSTTATSSITNALQIGSTARDNALAITASRTYPASQSVGGMVNFTCSSNDGPCFNTYSTHGSGATAPLVKMMNTNAAYDQTILTLQSASLSRTTLDITGSSTAQGTIKVTHYGGSGADANASLISLDYYSTTSPSTFSATQGLFMTSSNGGTTGKPIQIRNNLLAFGGSDSAVNIFDLTGDGKVGISSSTPWAYLSINPTAHSWDSSAPWFAIGSTTGGTKFVIDNTGTTTSSNGFNITAGCFSINNNCISGGGGSGTVTNIATTWPIIGGPITTTGTLTFGGLSTSSAAVVSNIPYFSGVNTFANVATTTLTASSPLALSNPVAKIGGSNSVLTLDTSGTWTGNAGTASALAANGSNCSSGSFAAGVDASGVAEGCADVWTEAENTAAAYAAQATTLTIAGTANQITSSAGAQSLSTDRTWTLSIPSQFNIQQASTTLFSANTGYFNSFSATSTTATSSVINAFQLGSTAGDHMVTMTPSRTYSASASVGGAFNLDNTLNDGTGLQLYTNHGASATGRLGYINCANTAFDQECLGIRSVSSGGSALGVIGSSTSKGVIKATSISTAGDANAAVLSLDIQGAGTAAQGIFMDATGGGTTGKLLNLRNNGTEYLTLSAGGLLTYKYASSTIYSSFQTSSSTSAYVGTLNLPNISGTQCLHSVSGVVSGTGSDCGSGSGLSSYDAWSHPSAGTSATSSGLVLQASSTAVSSFRANNLSVGKAPSASIRQELLIDSTFTQGLRMEADASTRMAMSSYVTGDAQVRFTFRTDGLLGWGDGTAVTDASLSRTGVGTLQIDNNLNVSQYLGVGTTTRSGTYQATFSSSTAPQLSLGAGAGNSQWTFRNAGGSLYLATTTVAGTATSSVSAFSINSNGQVTIPFLGGNTEGQFFAADSSGNLVATSSPRSRDDIRVKAWGIQGENMPLGALPSNTILVSQRAYYSLIGLKKGDVITGACIAIATASASSNHTYIGLYNSALSQVAVSSDQTTTYDGTTGTVCIAFTGTYTVPSTDGYFVAFLSDATTPPTLIRGGSAGGVYASPFSGARLFATQSSLTSLPSTATLSGSSNLATWMGVY